MCANIANICPAQKITDVALAGNGAAHRKIRGGAHGKLHQ